MGYDEVCETSLVLELGHHEYRPESSVDFDHQEINKKIKKTVTLQYDLLLPSLTLGCPTYQFAAKKIDVCKVYGGEFTDTHGHASNSRSTAVSSFSNSRSVKREKEVEVDHVERVSPRVLVINEEDEEVSARKKLRLTKEQGLILENSFKDHATLNPKQKQALARRLNLRTRQVEVWFQNRRARTKLKKTEVECELLKKCCETLTDENKRLQKELQDLKAIKLTTSFYMQLPAATLNICPSCQTIAGSGDNGSSKSPFVIKPKPHFYKHHFTNPSATC